MLLISTLYLRITNRCNQKCSYCYISEKNTGDVSDSTLSKFIALAEYIQKYNMWKGLNVKITGGEILLISLPKLDYLFSALKKLGISISINTNGTLLTLDHVRLFQKYNIQVGISLDGPRDIHNTRRSNSFDAFEDHAWQLCNTEKFRHGFICVINEDSTKHIEEIYEFFKRNKISPRFNPGFPDLTPESWKKTLIYTADRMFNDNFSIQEGNIREIIQHFMDVKKCNTDKNFRAKWYSNVCDECYQNFITVNWDGSVTTCHRLPGLIGFEKYIIGNIDQDLPADILFGPKRQELIKQLYQRKEQKCFTCEIYPRCKGGCSHACILYNGSITAPDPFCGTYQAIYQHVKEKLEECNYTLPGRM